MNKKKATALLTKYGSGELGKDDELRLNQWYLQQIASSKDSLSEEALKESYDYLKNNLPVLSAPPRFKLWPRLAGIAAAIAIIVSAVYLITYNKTVDVRTTTYINDIAPGKAGATLTLADGKKIRLTDVQNGELANEAGISISKTADGQVVYEIKGKRKKASQVNTLSTGKGETYILTLPDKSKVWLNAASSLSYSASLYDGGLRRVKLQGEAYFEIAKDSAHPFIVQTAKQKIEVLGTHFNVNSYQDEPGIATTLLEGSVKIIDGTSEQIIKPGEQAINRAGAISVNKVDPGTVTDWKNGDFNLDKVNFKVAMRKIARWYDVEVIYDTSITDDMEAGGWVSRESNLSSILKLIESSGLVRFKVDGRKVYVYK